MPRSDPLGRRDSPSSVADIGMSSASDDKSSHIVYQEDQVEGWSWAEVGTQECTDPSSKRRGSFVMVI